MYLPVPVSGTGEYDRAAAAAAAAGPSTRDVRAASIRSRRAAERQALKPPTSRPAPPTNAHGSRRSHRKVRTGCTKCKERKIKCDEAKPSCWQCTRHNVVCDFSNSRPSSTSGASPSASDSGLRASLNSISSPGLRSERDLPVNSDIVVEDATIANDLTNSNGDDQDESLDPSAAAAFAFLEQSFHFDRDNFAIHRHAQPTQMPYDVARDTPFTTSMFSPGAAPSMSCCASATDHASLNMTDLFLLHHFTTVTAQSLCPWHADVQQWWTHEVPRVAVRHPFVMRSLLTLAGLHVAHLCESGEAGDGVPQPEDGTDTRAFHIARAIEQHKLAGQTAASMLLTLDKATSAPMYVFSVLTQITSMAMPWPQQAPGSTFTWDSTGVHEWLRLLRGVRTISDLGLEWGVEGDAFLGGRNESTMPRELITKDQHQSRSRAASDVKDGGGTSGDNSKRRSRWHVMHEPPLAALREYLLEGDGSRMEIEGSAENVEARDFCLQELEQLVFVFSSFLDQGENIQTVRLIFSWLCRLEEKYLDYMSQHEPYCLILFTYHAVLLHWTDRAWWMDGWGLRIIDSVSIILGGNESKYKEWLKWPRMQVGLPELG